MILFWIATAAKAASRRRMSGCYLILPRLDGNPAGAFLPGETLFQPAGGVRLGFDSPCGALSLSEAGEWGR